MTHWVFAMVLQLVEAQLAVEPENGHYTFRFESDDGVAPKRLSEVSPGSYYLVAGTDIDGDGIREDSSGLPFKLRLFTRRALPETGVVGQEIADSLRAIGLEVTISDLTDSELARRIRKGRYDLFLWGWDAGSDPSFITSVLTCGEATAAGLSDTYFCDPNYDRLYESYLAAQGARKRQDILTELQLYAYLRSPYIVLYYRPTFQAFRADRFETSTDRSIPIVFATPPQSPINLKLRMGAAPRGPVAGAEFGKDAAVPADGLIQEIRSSLLWRLLALAGLIVLTLILLPRAVRGALWLSRRRKRAQLDKPENDGGRP